MKKLACAVLALLLLLGLMVPVVAADTVVEISTAAQLSAIRDHLNGNYRLVKDIELDGEWEPIGKKYNVAFTGTLDGNGHTIKGLTVNLDNNGTSAVYAGLFGHMNGTVRDLILEDVDIRIQDSNSARAGAVAGQSQGVIEGVTVTGKIQALDGTKTTAIGGLVGRQTKTALISRCSVDATVKSTGNTIRIGGLVGENEGGSVLSSASVGKVDGNATYILYIGGLVGNNRTAVTGNVSSEATVVNCLRDGKTVGFAKSNVVGGGLIGWNDGGVVRDSITLKPIDFTGDTGVTAGQIIGDNSGEADTVYYVKNDAGVTAVGSGTVISATKLSKDFTQDDVRELTANNDAWTFENGSLQLKDLLPETGESTTTTTTKNTTTTSAGSQSTTSSNTTATTTGDSNVPTTTRPSNGQSSSSANSTTGSAQGSQTNIPAGSSSALTSGTVQNGPTEPGITTVTVPDSTANGTTTTGASTNDTTNGSTSSTVGSQDGASSTVAGSTVTADPDGGTTDTESGTTTKPVDAPVQGGLAGDSSDFGDDDTTDDERLDQNGNDAILWIVIGAVIAVAGVAVAMVLILKKRKHQAEENQVEE